MAMRTTPPAYRALFRRPVESRLLALTDWSPGRAGALTSNLLRSAHELADLDLFADPSLARVLDRHPRQDLQAFTMGRDPASPSDWTPVEVGDVSGVDMLRAVATGRLWLNVLHVNRAHPEFAEVQDGLFAGLAELRSDLITESVHSTLLISSPGALVYYHADAGPSVLWHVRGDKRIWIYPAQSDYFVEQPVLEDIFASVREENLPYRREFDGAGVSFDLHPGDMIAWPQNAPHRVENGNTINVSLTTEFDTRGSRRRTLVYSANRFFSRRLHLACHSTRETGVASATKRLVYRVARKVGFDRTRPSYTYLTRLRIDPTAPDGVAPLAETVRTAFSVGEPAEGVSSGRP
jgi:hypothetical protein